MAVVLVDGAKGPEDLPGLGNDPRAAGFLYASDESEFLELLPGAEVLLGWNFRGKALRHHWDKAEKLRWIHWCGAGVDALLFPELAASDVVLTNSRGIFDHAMAEYVLGYMLSEVKCLEQSRKAQQNKIWGYRLTKTLRGQKACIYGVGSIGRAIAAMIRATGMKVVGVGRSERAGDQDFEHIYDLASVKPVLQNMDWVIAVMPSVASSRGIFNAEFYQSLSPKAHFINVGRGDAVDETALLQTLQSGHLAGAMLDVFHTEPLPEQSALWECPRLFISAHMSGDYETFQEDMVQLFLDNLKRYEEGTGLINKVDKKLGFVSA